MSVVVIIIVFMFTTATNDFYTPHCHHLNVMVFDMQDLTLKISAQF